MMMCTNGELNFSNEFYNNVVDLCERFYICLFFQISNPRLTHFYVFGAKMCVTFSISHVVPGLTVLYCSTLTEEGA